QHNIHAHNDDYIEILARLIEQQIRYISLSFLVVTISTLVKINTDIPFLRPLVSCYN
ncbi:hypothetical protein D047_0986B, partial [Vibrio parahaemolyticus VPTS-2010_2]